MSETIQQDPVIPVRARPVAAAERIASVDVLRGSALLGILVMNIYAYALPFGVYFNPMKGGGDSAFDRATWWLSHVLFEMKFMTLFSALFGAGLVLLAERATARGTKAGWVYYPASTVNLIFFGFWRVAGLMVVGMGLMKLGVFSAARSKRFYVLCCVLGYGVGLPVVVVGARLLWAHEFDLFYLNRDGGGLPNYLGSLLVALGHLGVVMLVCKTGVLGSITRRLAAVGRMALTNYLSHTIVCTTVFYGYGLGLFGSYGRFRLMFFVLGIWVLQLAVSPIWLRRFRFGPAEWLWRSLTYWKRQPMRGAGLR